MELIKDGYVFKCTVDEAVELMNKVGNTQVSGHRQASRYDSANEDDLKRILEMTKEQGITAKSASRKLGKSLDGATYRKLRKLGYKGHHKRKGGFTSKRWTQTELDALKREIANGNRSKYQLSRLLNRTKGAIHMKVWDLKKKGEISQHVQVE